MPWGELDPAVWDNGTRICFLGEQKEPFTPMFYASVYGELHRSHCCVKGSIRLLNRPREIRGGN